MLSASIISKLYPVELGKPSQITRLVEIKVAKCYDDGDIKGSVPTVSQILPQKWDQCVQYAKCSQMVWIPPC